MQAVGMLGNYISQGVYTVSGPFHPFGGAVDVIVVQEKEGTFKTSPWYVKFGKFQGVLKSREKIVNIAVNGVPVDFHMYLDRTGEAYFLKDVEYGEDETMLSPPSAPSSGDEIVEYDKGGAFTSEVPQSGLASVEVKQDLEGGASDSRELDKGNSAAGCQGSQQCLSIPGSEKIEHVTEDTSIGVSRAEANGRKHESIVFSETRNACVDSGSSETMQPRKTLLEDGETEIPRMDVAKSAKSIHRLACPDASERLSSSGLRGDPPAAVDFHQLTSPQRAEIVADLLDRNWGIAGDIGSSVSARSIGKIHSFGMTMGSTSPEFTDRKFLPQGTEKIPAAEIICGEDTERSQEDASSEEKAALVEPFLNRVEKTKSDTREENSIVRITAENNATFPQGLGAGNLSNDRKEVEVKDVASQTVEVLAKTIDKENAEVIIMSVDGHIVRAPVLPHDHQSSTRVFDQDSCDFNYAVRPVSQTLHANLRLEDSKILDVLCQSVSPVTSPRITDKPCLHDSVEPLKFEEVREDPEGENRSMSFSEPEKITDVEGRADSRVNNFDLLFNEPLGRTVLAGDSVAQLDCAFESREVIVGEHMKPVTGTELSAVFARKKNDLYGSSELLMATRGNSSSNGEENTAGLREPLVCEPEYEVLDTNEAVTTDWVLEEEDCNSTQVMPIASTVREIKDENAKPFQHNSKSISIPQINATLEEEEEVWTESFVSGSLPSSFFDTEKFDGKHTYCQSVASQPLPLVPLLPDSDDTFDMVRVSNHMSSSSMDIAGFVAGEELDRQAKRDTLFETGKDDADSQEIVELAKTCNTGIEISLCRHLLSEGMGIEAAAKAFASEIISFEEFERSGSAIIANDKLVVKIGERYFPWVAAAPVILGIMAFGMEVTHETPGTIAVEATNAIKAVQNGDGTLVPSSSRWRLWPFTFRRSKAETHVISSVSNNALLAATEAAIQSHYTEELLQKHGYYSRPRRTKERSYVPTSQQLALLNLKDGPNNVTFTFSTRVLGRQQVDARIYLWKWNTRIVISDVDGTITKSDVLGQFMPLVGKDWTHSGVTCLFSAIKANGYELLFLSARAISQAYLTRQFLVNLKQDGETLPDGPVVISPDGLFPSFYREVIRRAPHEFKISCLEVIRELFPSDVNPFYAGFGNRETDEISYCKVGIPKGKIFIINPKGEVVVNHHFIAKSYTSLHSLVDDMFPPMSTSEQEDFNSWNFWKMPLPDIDEELNEKGNSNQRAKRGGDSKR